MGESATSSDLQKAYIQVLDAQGKVKEDGEIPVLFNPGEYSMDKSNEFANINIPGLENGLKTAERGPTTILAIPSLMRFHSRNFLLWSIFEWKTATSSPNLETNLSTV